MLTILRLADRPTNIHQPTAGVKQCTAELLIEQIFSARFSDAPSAAASSRSCWGKRSSIKFEEDIAIIDASCFRIQIYCFVSILEYLKWSKIRAKFRTFHFALLPL